MPMRLKLRVFCPISHILRVLPLLAISAFEQKESKTATEPRAILHLQGKAKGIAATGYVQPGGFVAPKAHWLAASRRKGFTRT
jgi:hypothetical protein